MNNIRIPPRPDRKGKPRSLAKLILLGGVVTIVTPGTAMFVWAWSTAWSYDPGMVSHDRSAPMSSDAAFNAAIMSYLITLFLGLPLFGLWSVACLARHLVHSRGQDK